MDAYLGHNGEQEHEILLYKAGGRGRNWTVHRDGPQLSSAEREQAGFRI